MMYVLAVLITTGFINTTVPTFFIYLCCTAIYDYSSKKLNNIFSYYRLMIDIVETMKTLSILLGPMRVPFLLLPPVCVVLGAATAFYGEGFFT